MPQPKKASARRPDDLTNYFAILMIAPAILSIMAYLFLSQCIYTLFPERGTFHPLDSLGMLIPMALLMELFNFFLTRVLVKKFRTLTDGMKKVSEGDYSVELPLKNASPFTEGYEAFNRMTKDLSSVKALRSSFVNDFSHEFKTPITSINGFANLLLDTEVSEEERNEYLRIIADESARLSRLAEDTILLSKLETAPSVPDAEPYRLDEQIRQDVILLSPAWNGKNLQVEADLERVTYTGNASLMTHVWINLLNNAIKFTPEGGTITVRLTAAQDRIIASVADSGIGMTKEECARIFDQYYQADTSHSGQGLGLGLSIVKKVVELAGGTVSVESTPGKGSVFTVVLPQERTDS